MDSENIYGSRGIDRGLTRLDSLASVGKEGFFHLKGHYLWVDVVYGFFAAICVGRFFVVLAAVAFGSGWLDEMPGYWEDYSIQNEGSFVCQMTAQPNYQKGGQTFCRKGWYHSEHVGLGTDKSKSDVCYKLGPRPYTWTKARIYCEAYHYSAHLATIESEEENLAVKRVCEGKFGNDRAMTLGTNHCWIGLHKVPENSGGAAAGKWKWFRGTSGSYFGPARLPQNTVNVHSKPEWKYGGNYGGAQYTYLYEDVGYSKWQPGTWNQDLAPNNEKYFGDMVNVDATAIATGQAAALMTDVTLAQELARAFDPAFIHFGLAILSVTYHALAIGFFKWFPRFSKKYCCLHRQRNRCGGYLPLFMGIVYIIMILISAVFMPIYLYFEWQSNKLRSKAHNNYVILSGSLEIAMVIFALVLIHVTDVFDWRRTEDLNRAVEIEKERKRVEEQLEATIAEKALKRNAKEAYRERQNSMRSEAERRESVADSPHDDPDENLSASGPLENPDEDAV